jgi:hypothetical protein
VTTDHTTAPAAPSYVVRVLWWSLVAASIINIPFTLAAGLLRIRDLAHGGLVLFVLPLGLISFVTAIMTLLKAAADGTLTWRQRLAIAALALSMAPTYLLIGAMVYVFAEEPFQSPLGSLGCVLGAGALGWFFREIRPAVWTVAAERWSP